MKLRYLLVALLIVAGIALSGCTSPSPGATASPTALPTSSPTTATTATAAASPTPAASVAPTSIPTSASSSGAAVTQVGNLTASGVSIDWDTTDLLQHDTAHVTLQNVGTSVLQDVTVTYTVATPITLANSDGTTTTVINPVSNSVYVGKMSPTEVKDVAILAPDHGKNVAATVNIKVSWKGGEGTILQGVLSAPDGTMGTQKY